MNAQTVLPVISLEFDHTMANPAQGELPKRSSWLMRPARNQRVNDRLALHTKSTCEDFVQNIQRFMCEGQYEQALRFGCKAHVAMVAASSDDASVCPIRAKYDVYYGLALIYSGRASEGIPLLKTSIVDGKNSQDQDFILGRALNNLGYAYSVELGHQGLALRELGAALPHFRAPALREEYANTCDNIGRVYVRLHQRDLAQQWIDEAMELRLGMGDEYRLALSYNSQAYLCRTFGLPERAHKLAFEALRICQRLGKQRGTGAACINLGSARRQMATRSYIYSFDQRMDFLEEAVWYLNQAIDIFRGPVKEMARLIEAHYELGGVYGDRAALIRQNNESFSQVAKWDGLAEEHLKDAVDLARGRYPGWYIDACLALVRAYLQRGEFDKARAWLKCASEAVPVEYAMQAGGRLSEIPLEERVERFWYQLGEIELLLGYMAHHAGLCNDGRVSGQALEQSLEHFVRAYVYFEHFSPRSSESETTTRQLYEHFKKYLPDDLHTMQDKLLPQIAQTYSLNESDLRSFFEVTLDAALQIRDA